MNDKQIREQLVKTGNLVPGFNFSWKAVNKTAEKKARKQQKQQKEKK